MTVIDVHTFCLLRSKDERKLFGSKKPVIPDLEGKIVLRNTYPIVFIGFPGVDTVNQSL